MKVRKAPIKHQNSVHMSSFRGNGSLDIRSILLPIGGEISKVPPPRPLPKDYLEKRKLTTTSGIYENILNISKFFYGKDFQRDDKKLPVAAKRTISVSSAFPNNVQNKEIDMSKSVSIPLALSELKRTSFRRRSTRKEKRKETDIGAFVVLIGRVGDQMKIYGSTVERHSVKLGDEIIAVNDMQVEGKPHEEVVGHIQQCIRNKLIQLKVKRKPEVSATNPDSMPIVSEAYLVSVELDHIKQLTKTLQNDFPSIRVFDMEYIAAGKPAAASEPPAADSLEEAERLKKYEAELRERRESRLQRQKENDFLRTSLRASKKLKSLEQSKEFAPTIVNIDIPDSKSYDNPACVDSEEHNNNEAIPLKQVIVSVERIASHLSESGKEEDVRVLREYFQATPIQQAITETALQRSQRVPNSVPCVPANGTIGNGKECEKPEIPEKSDKQIETALKIVTLHKNEDAYLGATVRNEDGRVVVGRVIKGGIIEKKGLFNEGDELLEMNGIDLRGKKVGEVCDMMRCLSGDVRFVVAPTTVIRRPAPSHLQHVRALFDYDPEDDIYVPCKELALKFCRGDVLHVLSTQDDNWWQAYRDGEDTLHQLAGLIPSSSFRQQVMMYTEEMDKCCSTIGTKKEKKKIPQVLRTLGRKNSLEFVRSADEPPNQIYHNEHPCYEEVVLHLPSLGRRRPLILVGPEGGGCLPLRQRLLASDVQRLASPVPHTTRPPRDGEIDGIHYHFVSKQQFADSVKAGRFVEFGDFQKASYGTAIDDVIDVIKRGKTCVMTLKAESLLAVRTAEIVPFIVFVSPPSMVQLRRQRELEGKFDAKDDELKHIIQQGKQIEQRYGHLFDDIIVNIDTSRSIDELGQIIKRINTEPLWVPASWVTS